MTQCLRKNMSAEPVMCIYLDDESKGKTTTFYGSQRQATSLPNHAKTYYSCPSAVHTTMPLTI